MVNEERSLRTRRGPVRSGALRGALGDEFCTRLFLSAICRGTDRLALDRLNASMKPIAITRPQRLAIVEADALPATAHVQPPLVLTQRPLRVRSASKASAAR
jgi:hypothetical protein